MTDLKKIKGLPNGRYPRLRSLVENAQAEEEKKQVRTLSRIFGGNPTGWPYSKHILWLHLTAEQYGEGTVMEVHEDLRRGVSEEECGKKVLSAVGRLSKARREKASGA